MNQLVTVTFDGEVLRPEIPLDLDINQKYQIQVISETKQSENCSALGEKLAQIRQKIVDSGVKLLTEDEVEQEKAARRGGYQEDYRTQSIKLISIHSLASKN
jgi:hypothetical protein